MPESYLAARRVILLSFSGIFGLVAVVRLLLVVVVVMCTVVCCWLLVGGSEAGPGSIS